MMNFIALSLIATSLLVSGLFSPNAQSNGGKQEQVILKEGHRAVTVEYADDVKDGNTKVLISPQQPNIGPVDEQLSRAAASVAGVAQEVVPGQNGLHGSRPRELICDAYGKCKHKIAGAWGKTKEKAAEAEEAVEEAVSKVKDSAEGVRQDAKEKVREAGEAVGKTGEIGREKLEKGKAGEMVEETEDMIKEKSIKGKKELSDIGKRGKEVILDAIWNKADMFQGYNLMTSLLLVLGNLLFLEPRATKTMFNRMKLEKEEGRGRDKDHVSAPTRMIDTVVDDTTSPAPTATTTATTEPTTTTLAAKAAEDEAKTKLGKLDNRLKKLNSYSSLLNIMTLMGLTWHLVYLSQRLRANAC
ncbi:putative G-protein coupled receptor Mth-like 2 [Bienertia sinuspersici]